MPAMYEGFGWAQLADPFGTNPNTTFDDLIVKKYPTGSNYICDPPVTDTDIDTVILVEDDLYKSYLGAEGWTKCEGDDYPASITTELFSAWRKGNLNYIVTTDKKFYMKWVVATKIAKAMNLLNKEDRIKLFDAVLYQV